MLLKICEDFYIYLTIHTCSTSLHELYSQMQAIYLQNCCCSLLRNLDLVSKPFTSHYLVSSGCHGNRYQLMLSCWHSEPGARLNFTQLKYSFQSTIADSNTGNSYITIQPDSCYDTAIEGHL